MAKGVHVESFQVTVSLTCMHSVRTHFCNILSGNSFFSRRNYVLFLLFREWDKAKAVKSSGSSLNRDFLNTRFRQSGLFCMTPSECFPPLKGPLSFFSALIFFVLGKKENGIKPHQRRPISVRNIQAGMMAP